MRLEAKSMIGILGSVNKCNSLFNSVVDMSKGLTGKPKGLWERAWLLENTH